MSFTFNGVNSDDMGLIVERYPSRPFPTRKVDSYSIIGRSGDLLIEQDAWSNVTQEYEVFINGNFQQRAQAIAYWLLNANGYCELTDSYDTNDTYRMARFIGGVSFLNALNKYGKAKITFDCCPQRYPRTPEILSGSWDDTFTFPSHPNMQKGLPILTIPSLPVNASGIIETDTLRIVIPAQSSLINSVFIDWETQAVGTLQPNRFVSAVSITGTWLPLGDGDEIRTTLETGDSVPMTVETRRWYL